MKVSLRRRSIPRSVDRAILSRLNLFRVAVSETEIVQEETDPHDPGRIARRAFGDITADAFKWVAFVSRDDRLTWEPDQEFVAGPPFLEMHHQESGPGTGRYSPGGGAGVIP